MQQEWFDPVIFSVGPVQVRWYGILFVLSFLIGAWILRYLARRGFYPLSLSSLDKLITSIIIGIFAGARLAYVFIYNWEHYSANFLEIFFIWNGGLSFHGGVIGAIFSGLWFSRKEGVSFLILADCLALAGTPGLFLGRVGNFINGELHGRVTDSWVGMVFPGGGPLPRHPSQLYEGVVEGLLLFVILWYLLRRQPYYGIMSSVFLFGYSVFRFFAEFYREPDPQLGLFGSLTMGQILCLLMVPFSYALFHLARNRKLPNPLFTS